MKESYEYHAARGPGAPHHPRRLEPLMQIPGFGEFRKEREPLYGRPWSVDPAGASFTLTIPDADVVFEDEDDGLQPHEPSYRMALMVLDRLDAFRDRAAEYLAGVVDANGKGMHGESYFNHIICDAREKKVTVAMSWATDIYSEWSVTFIWPDWDGDDARGYHAIAMGFRSR